MKRRHYFATFAVALVGLFFADVASAMYHPGLGRHMQRDPHGMQMGPTVPRAAGAPAVNGGFIERDFDPHLQYADGMNLYQYVRSNPVNFRDSLGLATENCNRCGPDVTTELKRLAIILEGRFRMLDRDDKRQVCRSMYSAGGWDVHQLLHGTATTDNCPSEDCRRTVTVEGKCWNSYEVNYFRLLSRICG